MKKYKVRAISTVYSYAVVEAENEEEALEIAENMDVDCFRSDDDNDKKWEVDVIGEADENEKRSPEKEPVWDTWHDGWFEYYYCKNCGLKLQLTIDKTPLPQKCPKCGIEK